MQKVYLRRQGQALLLIVITLAVVMTVALSVAARSITDIKITTSEEDSFRAFSAAEAGIEKTLVTGSAESDTFSPNGASFSSTVSAIAAGLRVFNYPLELLSDDTATLWFVSHDANNDLVCNPPSEPCFTGNSLRVCWGSSATINEFTPAIQVAVYYDPTADGNYNDLKVAYAGYDPSATRRSSNFYLPNSGSNCSIGGKSYAFQRDINLVDLGISNFSANGLVFAQIKMLYNELVAEPVGFSTNADLPGQGRQIESIGQAGESTRKVQVYSLYPGFPSVFDSALFSPVAITK